MKTLTRTHGCDLLAQAVRGAYAQGQSDYSIEPMLRVDDTARPVGLIQDGDAVIFCCRRGAREIELTEAFTDPDFVHFPRPKFKQLDFVILTLYHEKFKDLPVAFAPAKIHDTLGETVCKAGLRQMRCAESEKFAHVTFFLNGGENLPFRGERDVRIPSPKGIPFDQVPELSLPQVADEVIRAIQSPDDLIVTNFANGDVIGHTANPDAKVKCAQAVDAQLGRVLQAAMQRDVVVVITADHGNLEEMFTPDGKPHVAHTTNLVPLMVIDPRIPQPLQIEDGSLQDIAPTVLHIMGVEQPEGMSGSSRLVNYPRDEKRRVLLIILDGWGTGRADSTNPIYLANTPVWDNLVTRYRPAQLMASGEAVGLQAGKAGNSEAGHMNIGAGRVVLQDDVRLDRAMNDGTFFSNEIFLRTIEGVKRRNTHLHLIGLLTEKSSHGSIDYPLALLNMARDHGLEEVYLHMIFDGRSTEPGSAPELLETLEQKIAEICIGQVVSGVGRGIALDRDGNYARIQRVYNALVSGIGQTYC